MKIFNLRSSLTTLLVLLCFNVLGQNQFEKVIYGPETDVAESVKTTFDGGFVVVGNTRSYGEGTSNNIYFIKLNPSGDIEWNKVFGSTTIDIAYSVIQTSDSGYAISGYRMGSGIIVIKTDEHGEIMWSKVMPNTIYGYEIIQTQDGGYAVVGIRLGVLSLCLIKLNASGDLLWESVSETDWQGGNNHGKALVEDTHGNIWVAGWTTEAYANGGRDVYVAKFSQAGNQIWSKAYGGSEFEEANSITIDAAGNIIVAGVTYSFGVGSSNFYVIKLNAVGDIIWTKAIGGGESETANTVIVTSENNYLVGGLTNSYGIRKWAFNHNAYLVKLSQEGDVVWTQTIGDSALGYESINALAESPDGGFVMVGNITSEHYGSSIWVTKTDRNGNSCKSNIRSGGDVASGGVAVSGKDAEKVSNPLQQPIQYVVDSGGDLGVNCEGTVSSVQHPQSMLKDTLNWVVYPNPSAEFITINAPNDIPYAYEIFDNTGKKMLFGDGIAGNHKIDLSNLAEGIYLLKVSFNNNPAHYKTILKI